MGLTVTAMGLEKKPGKHELKKHAATIHCSNALSLLQRKISNALLFHAYAELMQKDEHEISIRQLCQLISYSGNNHSAIKDALKGLLSTVIEWNVVNDTTKSEDWTASSILASVSLQGPLCYFAYSPRMKQLLHSPSMFGKINLTIQSRFKSSYGLALYENCIRYRGLPYTKWFDMETFRKLMGVPQDIYTIFRDFKRRVLDKSVEEVNTYSDLLVEPELARERRQVVKIRFCLKERAKKTRLGTGCEEGNDAALMNLRTKLIMQFNLTPRQVEQVLYEYSPDFIKEKIQVIEASKNYQQGQIKNVTAYFHSALKDDYQTAKPSNDILKEKKREKDRALTNFKELKRQAERLNKAYTTYREKTIDDVIKQMKKNEKAEFMQGFFDYAAASIQTILKLQARKYTRATILRSPQIKGLLREFAVRTLKVLSEKIIPIERFLENFPEQERNAWHQYKLFETHHPV
jgi:hypothetical protein